MNPFDTYRKLQEEAGQSDSVTIDVPLLIRIMEVCREDIKDDKEIHQFATQIVALKDRGVLGIKDWDDMCTCSKKNESVEVEEEVEILEAVSNTARHESDFTPGDKKGYAAHMKVNFGVQTSYHEKNKLKFRGPVANVRRALEYHYGDSDEAARKHKHLYQKSS